MRYCNHCRRITAGEPLFCNFCGRSYDHKLCPQRHPNPRTAEVCNQCGSRELSQPHPKVPLWLVAVLALASALPGFVLLLLSILFLIGFTHTLLTTPQLLFEFMIIGLFIAGLWWLYMKLPRFLRRWLSGLFGRGGHDDHGH